MSVYVGVLYVCVLLFVVSYIPVGSGKEGSNDFWREMISVYPLTCQYRSFTFAMLVIVCQYMTKNDRGLFGNTWQSFTFAMLVNCFQYMTKDDGGCSVIGLSIFLITLIQGFLGLCHGIGIHVHACNHRGYVLFLYLCRLK